MRCDAWVGMLLWWSCQSPVAHRGSLLNHLNSFRGGMFQLNAKFEADLVFYSLSHFECNSHTVHMLTQQHLSPPLTSPVKSLLFMQVHPVHSLWLPGYINVAQTVLVILTMVRLFLDRTCMCSVNLLYFKRALTASVLYCSSTLFKWVTLNCKSSEICLK